jgi:hypothetical protein
LEEAAPRAGIPVEREAERKGPLNWVVLAAVIVAVIFLGGCALLLQYSREATNYILDYSNRFLCYEHGFEAARYGLSDQPPLENAECAQWFAEGVADGEAGTYNPPSAG